MNLNNSNSDGPPSEDSTKTTLASHRPIEKKPLVQPKGFGKSTELIYSATQKRKGPRELLLYYCIGGHLVRPVGFFRGIISAEYACIVPYVLRRSNGQITYVQYDHSDFNMAHDLKAIMETSVAPGYTCGVTFKALQTAKVFVYGEFAHGFSFYAPSTLELNGSMFLARWTADGLIEEPINRSCIIELFAGIANVFICDYKELVVMFDQQAKFTLTMLEEEGVFWPSSVPVVINSLAPVSASTGPPSQRQMQNFIVPPSTEKTKSRFYSDSKRGRPESLSSQPPLIHSDGGSKAAESHQAPMITTTGNCDTLVATLKQINDGQPPDVQRQQQLQRRKSTSFKSKALIGKAATGTVACTPPESAKADVQPPLQQKQPKELNSPMSPEPENSPKKIIANSVYATQVRDALEVPSSAVDAKPAAKSAPKLAEAHEKKPKTQPEQEKAPTKAKPKRSHGKVEKVDKKMKKSPVSMIKPKPKSKGQSKPTVPLTSTGKATLSSKPSAVAEKSTSSSESFVSICSDKVPEQPKKSPMQTKSAHKSKSAIDKKPTKGKKKSGTKSKSPTSSPTSKSLIGSKSSSPSTLPVVSSKVNAPTTKKTLLKPRIKIKSIGKDENLTVSNFSDQMYKNEGTLKDADKSKSPQTSSGPSMSSGSPAISSPPKPRIFSLKSNTREVKSSPGKVPMTETRKVKSEGYAKQKKSSPGAEKPSKLEPAITPTKSPSSFEQNYKSTASDRHKNELMQSIRKARKTRIKVKSPTHEQPASGAGKSSVPKSKSQNSPPPNGKKSKRQSDDATLTQMKAKEELGQLMHAIRDSGHRITEIKSSHSQSSKPGTEGSQLTENDKEEMAKEVEQFKEKMARVIEMLKQLVDNVTLTLRDELMEDVSALQECSDAITPEQFEEYSDRIVMLTKRIDRVLTSLKKD